MNYLFCRNKFRIFKYKIKQMAISIVAILLTIILIETGDKNNMT